MRHYFNSSQSRGIGSIEVVIGAAILAVVLVFCIGAVGQFAAFGRLQVERTQALFLAQDTLEGVRLLRDASWSDFDALSLNTSYYIAFGPSSLSATLVPQTVGDHVPRFKIMSAYRATGNSDLVASTSPVSKSVDTHTKLIEVTVPFGSSTQSIVLQEYLGDIAP